VRRSKATAKPTRPAFIAARFAELVTGARRQKMETRTPRVPKFCHRSVRHKLAVKNGRVWIDTTRWPEIRAAVETHSGGLIIDRDGAPVAALSNESSLPKIPSCSPATSNAVSLAAKASTWSLRSRD